MFGFYLLKLEDFFDFTTTRSTRANHQYKLYVEPASLNRYKHSFFIKIVKVWNELPRNLVEIIQMYRCITHTKRKKKYLLIVD